MNKTILIQGFCRLYLIAGGTAKQKNLIPEEDWLREHFSFLVNELITVCGGKIDKNDWINLIDNYKTNGWDGLKYGKIPSIPDMKQKLMGADIMHSKIKDLAKKVIQKAKYIRRGDMGFIGDPIADEIIKQWGGLWSKTGGEILSDYSYSRMQSDFIEKYQDILKKEKMNIKGYLANPQNYCQNQTTSNLLLSSGDNVEKMDKSQQALENPQKFYTKEDIEKARNDAFDYLDSVFNNMLNPTPKKIKTTKEEFLGVFGSLLKPVFKNKKHWGVVR